MSWRDAFLHPRRDHGTSRPANTSAPAAGPGTVAASEAARYDAGARGRHADPDEIIHAEMAAMAERAAERAREEERDDQRVSMMVPGHRLEYRRMRWEAVSAVKLGGMSPQRIEQEYDAFRFAQWEQRNAERIAPMSPGERQEMFRSEELLTRYRTGLPARDAEEREAYQEWRQLDADVVDACTEEIETPERAWDEYRHGNGSLSGEEFFTQHIDELSKDRAASESAAPPSAGRRRLPAAHVANSADPPRDVSATGELSSESLDPDSSPGAARKLPGPTGAGSGLEDGPISPLTPGGAIPRGGDAPDAGLPLLVPPGDPAAPGQVRPGHGEGPSGPVPW